jgi:hypothetical protein
MAIIAMTASHALPLGAPAVLLAACRVARPPARPVASVCVKQQSKRAGTALKTLSEAGGARTAAFVLPVFFDVWGNSIGFPLVINAPQYSGQW